MRATAFAFLLLASLGVAPSLLAGVQTSSLFKDSLKSETFYSGNNLIDGDPKTVWIEGREGPGLGESFTLDLPRAEIKKVVILPGHGADERMFKKYSHLKEAKLEFYSQDDKRELKLVKTQSVTLEDAFKPQEFVVEGVKLGEELFGGQLKLTIVSVYPGIDFQDTAIGEVKVVLSEYPAQLDVTEISSSQKGFSKDNLIDGNVKTAWIADQPGPGQSMTINAPDFGQAAVVINAGNQKDPKKFRDNARPKEITIEVAKQTVKFTLKDTPDAQRIELPVINGYTGSLFGLTKITVDSVYPGTISQNVAIGEIQIIATNFQM
jgi:hypothetical protein